MTHLRKSKTSSKNGMITLKITWPTIGKTLPPNHISNNGCNTQWKPLHLRLMLKNSRRQTPMILKKLKMLMMLIQLLPLGLRLLNSKNGLQQVKIFLPIIGIDLVKHKPGNSHGSKTNAKHYWPRMKWNGSKSDTLSIYPRPKRN